MDRYAAVPALAVWLPCTATLRPHMSSALAGAYAEAKMYPVHIVQLSSSTSDRHGACTVVGPVLGFDPGSFLSPHGPWAWPSTPIERSASFFIAWRGRFPCRRGTFLLDVSRLAGQDLDQGYQTCRPGSLAAELDVLSD